MSFEKVKSYFESIGLGDRVSEQKSASDTVEHAAEVIGCKPEQIAKTMSFLVDEKVILIVMAGDAKVDNKRYKEKFGKKAAMIPFDEVENRVGHAPGGVCPFVINEGIDVYLDESLKRFDYVHAAAGSSNGTVKLTPSELETAAKSLEWIDVAKGWREEEKVQA